MDGLIFLWEGGVFKFENSKSSAGLGNRLYIHPCSQVDALKLYCDAFEWFRLTYCY